MHIYNVLIPFMFFCYTASSCTNTIPEKPIVVVILSWNNAAICRDNLASVFKQQYKNYRVIYVDDCSTDGNAQIVREYIAEQHQENRCTLIINEQHRGIMYNHYATIHKCPNHVIIVNLDGDDQFAHEHVLERINEAYQDENIWMTYGQYKEWPNKAWPGGKMGICRQIPPAIHHHRAYRYFDWVTSHPRTFYAGLFKAVPVGYFIHHDSFQPSAVDHAMMYAMLELSGGRVRFIDEVLYFYNCENPNNVFRKMLLTDMTMGYISRGREPLPSLAYDPRTSTPEKQSILTLIFSSENPGRALQLLSELSLSQCNTDAIYILYGAHTEQEKMQYQLLSAQDSHPICIDIGTKGLKETLLSVCTTTRYPYVLLLSDICHITSTSIDSGNMIHLLEKTHAKGFFMGLGKDTTGHPSCTYSPVQPPLIEVEPHAYVWKFAKASAQWRFVYTINGALYPMCTFVAHIQQSVFKTHQELEQALRLYGITCIDDVGVCYSKSQLTIDYTI
jgi:glycosyltransferase involved in cell wall biosynthesis